MNKNKIIRIVNTQESNVLDIRFWPTDICNYDCGYCFPGSKDAVYRYPKNIDTVIKNFRRLFDVHNEKFGKNTYLINLVGGGEPTMWPHLGQFCREIKEQHDVRIQVTSNGSRTLRWWEENSEHIDKAVLSCHHEFVNIEHFISVADMLYRKGVIINSIMLMDATAWDKCVGLINKMLRSKELWIVEAKSVVESPGKDINSYTPDQLAYINPSLKRIPPGEWILPRMDVLSVVKSVAIFDDGSAVSCRPETHINGRWNFFHGWKCDVAKENLVISYDGSVKGSCQEQLFKGSNLNIFSEDFIDEFDMSMFKLDSIICPRINCPCQPDTHISKSKTSMGVS